VTPLARLLEAALFAAPRPVPFDALAALDPEAAPAAVAAALDELREHYDVDGHGIELVEQGGGWQLLTRTEFAEALERAQVAVRPQRLSAAALETLAIVAYRQPIVKSDIEKIRGVDVTPTLKTLLERSIIRIVGRQASVGNPALYGTTEEFLKLFGLNSLGELPTLRDIRDLENDPGESGEEEAPTEEPVAESADPVPAH